MLTLLECQKKPPQTSQRASRLKIQNSTRVRSCIPRTAWRVWRGLIMMNQQFAVYPDSSITSSNPMAPLAEIVPPPAAKIHTLTRIKTTLSPPNHYSLTLFLSSVCSDSARCLFQRNHSFKSVCMQKCDRQKTKTCFILGQAK